MNTETTLKNLEADLAAMLGDTSSVELREFASLDAFHDYALSELVKATGDADKSSRVARLKHLLENVRMAPTLKFQDVGARSLPVYSGPLSVQAQTAWKERSERNITAQQAAASQAPGPKGFAQKGAAENILAAMQALLDKEEGTDTGTPAEDAPEASTTAGPEAGTASPEDTSPPADPAAAAAAAAGGDESTPANKSVDPWGTGLDMNTPDGADNSSLRVF